MLIGHQKQLQFLKKSAEMDKLPHAVLFYGPEQVGKKTLAIEFAKFLNCSSKNSQKRPCQICKECQDIQRGIYPDFVLIEPASLRGEIQISQIRDLIWKLSLRASVSKFKVAIIDRAHLMNQEAQSCFLKLLEEPKGRTILILITEHPDIMLSTIISRVQKLRFFPVEINKIESFIASKKIPQKTFQYLASISAGRPGRVINYLLNPQLLENQKKIISDLLEISQSDLSFRFQYVKKLIKENPEDFQNNLKNILNRWLEYFRELFHSRLRQNSAVSGQTILDKNKYPQPKNDDFTRYSLSKIMKIISVIQKNIFLLSTTNINSKLALELLLIEL